MQTKAVPVLHSIDKRNECASNEAAGCLEN
jgi:hypothetical protein